MITNRDDYLEHSSKNYTAEQKQYNNWLTERLLELAEQYNYIFDPEDFNFVAIRDRIRCYYKSYVQTARKRGFDLPGKVHIKKFKANERDGGTPSGGAGGEAESDDNDEHLRSSRHVDGKSSTASTPTTSNAEQRPRHVVAVVAASSNDEHEHRSNKGGESKQEQQTNDESQIDNDKTSNRGRGGGGDAKSK